MRFDSFASLCYRFQQGQRTDAAWPPTFKKEFPDEYDGIDMHGPHMVFARDIYGSLVSALFDELFTPSDDYVPLYTDEDARLPPPKPTKRYDLEFDRVAFWQDNGVWIAKLSSIEMEALGVDHSREANRALDQAEEDAFCGRLRMYGASFWTLPPKWPMTLLWCETFECIEPERTVAKSTDISSRVDDTCASNI